MATVIGDLWDSALDRSLLGYSSLGYDLRRRAGRLDDLPSAALVGQLAVVTGAANGLGKATALGLAALGAEVRIVVRSRKRGEQARDEIRAAVPRCSIGVDICDVSSLTEVREFAQSLEAVNVLIHNAGVMPAARAQTAEGHEVCLATHVLGPHLMTHLTMPAMRAAGAARVIWVSSGGMYTQRLNLDDIEYVHNEYKPTTAYARTKRMQVALAREWGHRLRADRITVHSAHPGWADTPGVAESLPTFRRIVGPVLRTPKQGADTLVWLATAAEAAIGTGGFWHDRKQRTEHYGPWTKESNEERSRLFELCDLAASGYC